MTIVLFFAPESFASPAANKGLITQLMQIHQLKHTWRLAYIYDTRASHTLVNTTLAQLSIMLPDTTSKLFAHGFGRCGSKSLQQKYSPFEFKCWIVRVASETCATLEMSVRIFVGGGNSHSYTSHSFSDDAEGRNSILVHYILLLDECVCLCIKIIDPSKLTNEHCSCHSEKCQWPSIFQQQKQQILEPD